MSIQAARDEYVLALRNAQKEYRELMFAGKETNPLVLEEVLPEVDSMVIQDIGLMEIPAQRIFIKRCLYRCIFRTHKFQISSCFLVNQVNFLFREAACENGFQAFGSAYTVAVIAHMTENENPLVIFNFLQDRLL